MRNDAVGSFSYGLVDAAAVDRGRARRGAPPRAGGPCRTSRSWTEPDGESAVGVRALVTPLDDGGALLFADEWRTDRGPNHALLVAFGSALVATLALGTIGACC